MTLQHIRQEMVLVIVAPILLAEPLGRALRRDPTVSPAPEGWPPLREVWAPIAVLAVFFVGLAVWRLAIPGQPFNRRTVPLTALAHVPQALRAKPVFNDYSFGGWLIFNGVRPFIDGRSDMYGDDFLKRFLDTESGALAAVATLQRYGVVWTILTPSSGLVDRLDHTPGWRRLYSDKWAVVQVRTDALAPPARASKAPTAPPPAP